jgi:hypothetical protein
LNFMPLKENTGSSRDSMLSNGFPLNWISSILNDFEWNPSDFYVSLSEIPSVNSMLLNGIQMTFMLY